mgnify:CR=1 FL=1
MGKQETRGGGSNFLDAVKKANSNQSLDSPESFGKKLHKKMESYNAGEPISNDARATPTLGIGYIDPSNELGQSKYDEYYSPGMDIFNSDKSYSQQLLATTLAENRAQLQPKSEKLWNGLGRFGSKVVTEFFKGMGYIGGALPAAVTSDIEKLTNNFFVEAFQSLEDETREQLPVYTRDAVQNGTFWRQVWSPEFWANEGADGLGFLVSAIATGGVTGAVSKSLKIGTGIAKVFGAGAKTAGMIDNFVISATQTFVESAAETKGIVDDLKKDWSQYQQEDGSYLKNGKKYSSDEVKDLIGQAGVNTLALNALFLLGPNMLQTKYLFGKGNSESLGLFNKVAGNNLDEMQEALTKMTPWKVGAKQALIHGPLSASAEAFQELSKFAIENYESKKRKR